MASSFIACLNSLRKSGEFIGFLQTLVRANRIMPNTTSEQRLDLLKEHWGREPIQFLVLHFIIHWPVRLIGIAFLVLIGSPTATIQFRAWGSINELKLGPFSPTSKKRIEVGTKKICEFNLVFSRIGQRNIPPPGISPN